MENQEIQENQDHLIITEADLASALDGTFLDKIREFAWRGKDAKIPDVKPEEISHFHVMVGFNFPADPEDKEPLTFAKFTGYRFHCAPVTYEDIRKAEEASQKENENTEKNT